jgi:hypothetical protein
MCGHRVDCGVDGADAGDRLDLAVAQRQHRDLRSLQPRAGPAPASTRSSAPTTNTLPIDGLSVSARDARLVERAPRAIASPAAHTQQLTPKLAVPVSTRRIGTTRRAPRGARRSACPTPPPRCGSTGSRAPAGDQLVVGERELAGARLARRHRRLPAVVEHRVELVGVEVHTLQVVAIVDGDGSGTTSTP